MSNLEVNRHKSQTVSHVLLGSVLMMLFATVLRVVNNMELPLYVDEAIHIIRGQLVLNGQIFAGVDQNKWLFGPFISVFNPTGPEAPFLARYLNALMGVLTLGIVIRMGRELFNWRVGLVAGLFYAVLPLAVFHERQANVDILMGVFAAATVLIGFRLTKRPSIKLALALGLCLAISRLTKAAMVGYFALPLAAVILFTFYDKAQVNWRNIIPTTKQRMKDKKTRQETLRVGAYAIGGIALSLVIVGVLYNMAEQAGQVTRGSHTIEPSNIATHLFWGRAAPGYMLKEINKFVGVHIPFISPTLIVLVLIAVVQSFKQADQRKIAYLAIPALIFAAIPIIAARPGDGGDRLAARYFYLDGPTTVILAALGVEVLAGWIHRVVKPLQSVKSARVHLGVVAVAFIVPLLMITQLIVQPQRSGLVYPPSSFWRGYEHNPMVQTLRSAHFNTTSAGMQILIADPLPVWLEAHFGPRVATIQNIGEGAAPVDQINNWLAENQIVVVVYTDGCPDLTTAIDVGLHDNFYCFELVQ